MRRKKSHSSKSDLWEGLLSKQDNFTWSIKTNSLIFSCFGFIITPNSDQGSFLAMLRDHEVLGMEPRSPACRTSTQPWALSLAHWLLLFKKSSDHSAHMFFGSMPLNKFCNHSLFSLCLLLLSYEFSHSALWLSISVLITKVAHPSYLL